MTTTIGGGTPSTSNPAYWDGEIPWIQSSNVLEDTLFDVDIPKAITQKGLEESAAQIVPKTLSPSLLMSVSESLSTCHSSIQRVKISSRYVG